MIDCSFTKYVSTDAMGFLLIYRSEPNATVEILFIRDKFKMVWINAAPNATEMIGN